MVHDKPNEFDTNYSSNSTILTAKFGNEAVKLIHLIGKNLYIIIALVVLIIIISITNAVGFHYIFDYDESIDFIIDISLSVILIIILIPLVRLFIRSKKVLDRWADMFERITLSTSLNLALVNRDKKSAIMAVGQAVEPIGASLQQYILESNSNLKEFTDVSFDNGLSFDILIDSTRVLNSNNDMKIDSAILKKVLHEYGAISIDLLDKTIDVESVKHFIEKIRNYTRFINTNISLGIIVGEKISQEAKLFVENYLNNKEKTVNLLILIEKPSINPKSDSSDLIHSK